MLKVKHTEDKDNALFTDKQWTYIAKAHARWNIKVGAVRSGKSYVDIAYMIIKRLNEVRYNEGLSVILGVSNGTIERNVLQPMRSLFGSNAIGSINASKGIVKIFDQDVYCIGAEKINAVGKIQGMSIKYAYGDEIAKWNKDVFMMLESRLDKSYSCFDGTCNPEGPGHWLKKWLDNPKLDKYEQDYILTDNTFLPESFIRALCDEYEGTVYYDRYILGKWALAEGMIYPRYKDALQEPPEELEKYTVSIDYGTQNAFAAILWGKSKSIWYAVKEYYWSGRDTGIQKTDEEYAKDLDSFMEPVVQKIKEEYEKHYNPYSGPEKIEVIIDPSAASFIALLKKRPWAKVRKADNAVLDGIRETSTAMYEGLIKINPAMENTIKELQGYVWDDKSGEDKPVKVADHACDAIRYFVRTKHIVRRRRNADLSGPFRS